MKDYFLLLYLVLLLLPLQSLSGQTGRIEIRYDLRGEEECTIGVANGSATSDGRPLLWKTRDYADDPDNEVKYYRSYPGGIYFLTIVIHDQLTAYRIVKIRR